MLPSSLFLLFFNQQLRKSLLHPAPPFQMHESQLRCSLCKEVKHDTTSKSRPSALTHQLPHGIMKYHFTFLKSSEKMEFTLHVCARIPKKLMVNHSLKHSIVVFCWKEIIKEAKQYQSTENSHLCPQSISFYTQRSTKSIW